MTPETTRKGEARMRSPGSTAKIKRLLKRQLFLRNRILVGTHHKAGTVWMRRVFGGISHRLGLTFSRCTQAHVLRPGPCDIFQHCHSKFDVCEMGAFRGVHVIRDPRDLIVSATYYHEKSGEPWLHAKRESFGGLSYQEKLCSFKRFDDKLLFEMEHCTQDTIDAMQQFDYSDGRFMTVKYEELIGDHELRRFEQIFQFLGFRGIAVGWCLVIAYRNSLFSGSVKSAHVRSGKAKQWPEYFKPIHRKRFDELFPDVLSRLGYQEDREWESLSCGELPRTLDRCAEH